MAKAQVGEYRTDFAVGVNGGYMLSKVSFTPDVPQNMLGGMTAGLTFRYNCEKYFKSLCAIVAEVNIAQTGWKEKIEGMQNQPLYYADDPDNSLHYEPIQTMRCTMNERLPICRFPSLPDWDGDVSVKACRASSRLVRR